MYILELISEILYFDFLINSIECHEQNQIDCESLSPYSDYCRWDPEGIGNSPDSNGSCEYSEIEYFFWTKDGEIEGESKEFVTNVSDIGDYVFSLILTDTYGENNSASTNITQIK